MKKIIKVKGMRCSSCEFLIKDSLNDLGITAKADYNKNEVTIEEFDPKKIDLEKVYKAIEENGYKVVK